MDNFLINNDWRSGYLEPEGDSNNSGGGSNDGEISESSLTLKSPRVESFSEDEYKYADVEAIDLDSGTGNSNGSASVAFMLEEERDKRLNLAFSTILGKISEDLSQDITEGDEAWNIEDVMMRRITKRDLNHCRIGFKKEKIALFLDTSGSCEEYIELFSKLSTIAQQLGHVEVYDAPNAGDIYRFKRDKHGNIMRDSNGHIIYDDKDYTDFRARTVLFCGDWDGINMIHHRWIKTFKKLYWFDCSRSDDTNPKRRNRKMKNDIFREIVENTRRAAVYDITTEMDIINQAKKIR